MLRGEIWRPVTVVGYQAYQVSNIGRVRWHGRPVLSRPGGSRAYAYRQVKLRAPPRRQLRKAVHLLVWWAFCGWVPPGWLVHHRDECTLNNALGNLRVISSAGHLALHRVARISADARRGRPRAEVLAAAAARREARHAG